MWPNKKCKFRGPIKVKKRYPNCFMRRFQNGQRDIVKLFTPILAVIIHT